MYEKLANLVGAAVKRWTSKSPKAYETTTNVAAGIGIVATIVTIIPMITTAIVFPPWAIPTAAFIVSVTAKMTVEK